MVLMALDHTRGFLSNAQFAPVDLAHTTPTLFFTRWVTHFCAPAFFLLAGLGASLSLARGRSLAQVSRFFLTRGRLVVLELTLVSFGWDFTFHYTVARRGHLGPGGRWCCGGTCALPRAIAAVGVALIGLHNMTTITRQRLASSWLWRFPISIARRQADRIDYPIIPWVGVMAVGYAMGPIFQRPPAQAEDSRWLSVSAVISLSVSMAEQLWRSDAVEVQTRGTYNLLSFLRVWKYPPSLPTCS
jgi:uncharacterized membrane protein